MIVKEQTAIMDMEMSAMSTHYGSVCGTVGTCGVQEPCSAITSLHGVDITLQSTPTPLVLPTTGEGDNRGWGNQSVTPVLGHGCDTSRYKTGARGHEQDEYWMWGL